jgi:hypothetical protein
MEGLISKEEQMVAESLKKLAQAKRNWRFGQRSGRKLEG